MSTTGQKGRAKSAEERARLGASQRAAWARRRTLDADGLHEAGAGRRIASGPPAPVLGAYGARLAKRAVGLFGAPIGADDEGPESETGDAA